MAKHIFLLDDLRARLDALKSIRPDDIIEWMTECPDDDGFYSVEVDEVWLDHDLLPAHYGGDWSDGKTGLDFVRMICENQWFPNAVFYVHTSRVERGSMMVDMLRASGRTVIRSMMVCDPESPRVVLIGESVDDLGESKTWLSSCEVHVPA